MAHESLIQQRQAGILLHPTSLPDTGKGCLGAQALRFIDFLHSCGQCVWQMLPIGPTHSDGSPYLPLSAYAGNPRFIDVADLQASGWLDRQALENTSDHAMLLALAFDKFYARHDGIEKRRFRRFVRQERKWLRDYALFQLIRHLYDGQSWLDWPQPLRDHDESELEQLEQEHAREIDAIYFQQYVFARQWKRLKRYANRKNVKLFGDMPIFVSFDSAEVWAERRYFDIDETGQPRFVAGVPPDYFSATGQRWGNPHYDWEYMRRHGFDWWLNRFAHELKRFDIIRIDHFRGFEACWKIPAHCETAVHGEWVKVPGGELFETLHRRFGELPLVAEDLGIITPEVTALRKRFELPGMAVLQFAFDDMPDNPHRPDNYEAATVAYTGTHDNDTTLGWFNSLDEQGHQRVARYIEVGSDEMPWPMIRAVMESRACLAIIPMQDVLMLDGRHRMNTPGTAKGNWRWAFVWEQLSDSAQAKLANITYQSKRACLGASKDAD